MTKTLVLPAMTAGSLPGLAAAGPDDQFYGLIESGDRLRGRRRRLGDDRDRRAAVQALPRGREHHTSANGKRDPIVGSVEGIGECKKKSMPAQPAAR